MWCFRGTDQREINMVKNCKVISMILVFVLIAGTVFLFDINYVDAKSKSSKKNLEATFLATAEDCIETYNKLEGATVSFEKDDFTVTGGVKLKNTDTGKVYKYVQMGIGKFKYDGKVYDYTLNVAYSKKGYKGKRTILNWYTNYDDIDIEIPTETIKNKK